MTAPTREHRHLSPPTLALLGLCLVGFAWRVAGLGFQSLWRDEVDTLRFATRPLAELVRTFSKPGENGPLFFLAVRPWLEAAGQSEFALRFPAAAAGVVAVPLTYALARRLIAHAGGSMPSGISLANTPLVAALLVTVNPYLTWYSQEGKMYAWLTALVLAAHLAFLAAVDASQSRGYGWPRWLLYVVLLALAALTHVLAILMVAVHALWLVCLWPASRRSWLPFALTLLAPALPYFALVGWWQMRLFLNPTFQTGHPFVPLDDMVRVLLEGFGQGVTAPVLPLLLTGVIFLLLTGVTLGAAAVADRCLSSLRLAALLLTWIAAPPLLLFLITLRKPLFADRYLIWIMPALAIAAALGLAALRRAGRPFAWLALVALLAVNLWAGARQVRIPIKADWRSAAAYVTAHRRPGDRLLYLIPYNRYSFEYYAGPQADWADGPYTNNGNPPQQVADEMQRATQGAPAVWLIASEETLWDSRGLVRAWLTAQGQVTASAPFNRVEVVRYQLAP